MRVACVLIFLFISILPAQTGADNTFAPGEICYGNADRRMLLTPVSPILIQLRKFAEPRNRPLELSPQRPPTICVDKEKRLGYKGFMHCPYHPLYQIAFAKWNCKCYTGQCRPTRFRLVPITKDNLSGVEIFISGGWFAVPPEALRKERADMPAELLQWDAHVCTDDQPPQPNIECAWINVGS